MKSPLNTVMIMLRVRHGTLNQLPEALHACREHIFASMAPR